MNEKRSVWLSCLGIAALIPIIIALGCCVNGVVVSMMWDWFIVPLGIAKLSVPHAIGIFLLARICAYQTSTVKQKDDRKMSAKVADYITGIIVWPSITVLVGWIVKGLM